MSLIAIKEYLMKVKVASLSTLCSQFNETNPSLLRDMLRCWVQKGKIRCFSKTPYCGGKCMKCDVAITEIYEWVM